MKGKTQQLQELLLLPTSRVFVNELCGIVTQIDGAVNKIRNTAHSLFQQLTVHHVTDSFSHAFSSSCSMFVSSSEGSDNVVQENDFEKSKAVPV